MDWLWGTIYSATNGWTPDQSTVDYAAGFGDTLSFGITDKIRDWNGTNYVVDKCSGAYSAGEWTGIAYGFALGGALGLRAAGGRAAGMEFSHWIPSRARHLRIFQNRLGRWILRTGNRLNGNYVTAARHYLHDPFRYPRGWRDLGPRFPALIRQFDRLPNVLKGLIAGGAAAGVGASQSGGGKCGCN